MKITILESNNAPLAFVTQHGDESIEWSAATYDKPNFKSIQTLFSEINIYFASLPLSRQKLIWDCYKEIYAAIEKIVDPNRMTNRLRTLLKDLYVAIQYDEIVFLEKKLERGGQIVLPRTLKTELGPEDIPSITYLVDDYRELVCFTLALRPLVPIWSHYVRLAKSTAGTVYKESQAFSLLALTDLVKSAPVERLRTYVTAIHDPNLFSMAALLDGLGSEETPDWLLAITVVRRACIGELNTGDTNTLISNIWNSIDQNSKSMDRKFGGTVRDKFKNFSSGGEDGENAAKLEKYKVRTETSDGAIQFHAVYTDDCYDLAQRVEPGIPKALIKKCVDYFNSTKSFIPLPHQRFLAKWVLPPVISAPAFEHFTKPEMVNSIIATQAILWHRGFPELAILASLKPREMMGDVNYVGDFRDRMYKEHQETLNLTYPHQKRKRRRSLRGVRDNVGINAISIFIEEFDNYEWLLAGPVDLINEIGSQQTGGIYTLPANIKNLLAVFITDIARRIETRIMSLAEVQ